MTHELGLNIVACPLCGAPAIKGRRVEPRYPVG
jgi:hypothetical protein